MFDAEFRPNLVDELSDERLKLIDAWGMDLVGQPIESENDRKVAVWKGKFNDHGEAPVLIVSVEGDGSLDDSDALWFCGVALQRVIESSVDDAAAYADAATQPAKESKLAVEILNSLLTGKSYYEPLTLN